MALVDYHDVQIERDIGDKWGRTPHLVTTRENGNVGALYIPTPDGKWMAFGTTPQGAIAYLAKHYPPRGQGALL